MRCGEAQEGRCRGRGDADIAAAKAIKLMSADLAWPSRASSGAGAGAVEDGRPGNWSGRSRRASRRGQGHRHRHLLSSE